MLAPLKPDTLCYVTCQCPEASMRGAIVVTVRPMGRDEGVYLGDGTCAVGPHDSDLWWIQAPRVDTLLPLTIRVDGEVVYHKLRPRSLCAARHLVPIAGPGLELPCDPVATPLPQPAEAL